MCLPFLNLMDLLTRQVEGRSNSFSQPTWRMEVVTRMESSLPGLPGEGEERGAGEGGVGAVRSDWQSEGGGEDGLEKGGGAEVGEVQQCEWVAGLQELENLKEGGRRLRQ